MTRAVVRICKPLLRGRLGRNPWHFEEEGSHTTSQVAFEILAVDWEMSRTSSRMSKRLLYDMRVQTRGFQSEPSDISAVDRSGEWSRRLVFCAVNP